MKANSSTICGRNTITLPTPAITPSMMKLLNRPAGSTPRTMSPSAPAPVSIRSIIGVAQAKTDWNTMAIASRKAIEP